MRLNCSRLGVAGFVVLVLSTTSIARADFTISSNAYASTTLSDNTVPTLAPLVLDPTATSPLYGTSGINTMMPLTGTMAMATTTIAMQTLMGPTTTMPTGSTNINLNPIITVTFVDASTNAQGTFVFTEQVSGTVNYTFNNGSATAASVNYLSTSLSYNGMIDNTGIFRAAKSADDPTLLIGLSSITLLRSSLGQSNLDPIKSAGAGKMTTAGVFAQFTFTSSGSVVPEPASCLMVGLGLAGLVGGRAASTRRRRSPRG